jgi:phenylalanyl-tRNA synthetase alpha chain
VTELLAELPRLEGQARERLVAAVTVDELRAVEQDVLGKRSPLAGLNASLGRLPAEERKAAGQAINEARGRVRETYEERRGALEAEERRRRLAAERLDLTELVDRLPRGHLHPSTQAREELEDVFVGMGFAVAEGPEAETDWYNFEALNMPPHHPARSMWDTLYLKVGEPGSVLLRTHTSPVQIRVMQSQRPPIYSVMPGRCYRRETPDARHLAVFHQIEGLVVDHGISFADLAGTIEAFTTAYFGPDIQTRLRPSYFPFTEPSAEFEVTCIFCQGAGCRTCSHTGWIELGGCGMVHPNVFKAAGVDPEEFTGFAFGFGIDRLDMMKRGVDDLRHYLTNDIRFLRQFS